MLGVMLHLLDVATSVLATVARLGFGERVGAVGARAARPVELYDFEGWPFCRLVREELCELEVPYVLHNVAQGSSRREAFVARSGKMMVPYLVDPNRGLEMFESADIIAHLRANYAA